MKTHTTLLISSFFLHTFVGCTKKSKEGLIVPVQPSTEKSFPLHEPSSIDSTEYEIYSLILRDYNQHIANVKQETKKLSKSSIESAILFFADSNVQIDTSLVTYAPEQNDSTYYFDKKFIIPSKEVLLITSQEFEYLFRENDPDKNWQNYYNKYGSGYIGFSRVGFNEAKTKAVLEMSYSSAPLGGGGYYIYLEKGSSGWAIIKIIPTWMA